MCAYVRMSDLPHDNKERVHGNGGGADRPHVKINIHQSSSTAPCSKQRRVFPFQEVFGCYVPSPPFPRATAY